MDRETIVQEPWGQAAVDPMSEAARAPYNLVEWPTVCLCGAIYLGWMFLTVGHEAIPIWALFVLGGLVSALHASFQHEATHGHPTRNPGINACLAAPSLLLWLPFGLFRREHLQHHGNDALTDPLDDPESFYVLEDDWRGINPVRRGLLLLNNTLAGRMIVGPLLVMGGVLWRQRLWRGQRWYLH